MKNFTPIPNETKEYLRTGKMSFLEFGVYVLLHLEADWTTGICHTCALTLAWHSGDCKKERQIQRALLRLKRKRYINYRVKRGHRGCYPILIDKYEPREGALCGKRLNAWKHERNCTPEYEAGGCECPERALTEAGERVERGTNKEVRSKNEEVREVQRPFRKGENQNQQQNPNLGRTTPTGGVRSKTTEELRLIKRTYEQGGARPPQIIIDELARREDAEKTCIDQTHASIGGNAQPVTIDRIEAAAGRFQTCKSDTLTVAGLQAAYAIYTNGDVSAILRPEDDPAMLLAWASRNLGRQLLSLFDLSRRDATRLQRILVGEKPDLAWPRYNPSFRGLDSRRHHATE
jgi:hypothetical protein